MLERRSSAFSGILGPDGRVIGEPLIDDEGIVYAEIDLVALHSAAPDARHHRPLQPLRHLRPARQPQSTRVGTLPRQRARLDRRTECRRRGRGRGQRDGEIFNERARQHRIVRVGQIVPSSNTTMETEIPAMLRAARDRGRRTFHLPLQPHADEEGRQGGARGHGPRQRPLRTRAVRCAGRRARLCLPRRDHEHGSGLSPRLARAPDAPHARERRARARW